MKNPITTLLAPVAALCALSAAAEDIASLQARIDAAAAAGGRVVVEGLSPEIRQVFMMTGFLQLFEIK